MKAILTRAKSIDMIIKRKHVDMLKLHISPIVKAVGVTPKSPAMPCVVSEDIIHGLKSHAVHHATLITSMENTAAAIGVSEQS